MLVMQRPNLSVYQSDDGRCRVDVPWDAADDLQAFFQRRGIPCTLCLDPREREARIELRGVSAERAEMLLEEMPG